MKVNDRIQILQLARSGNKRHRHMNRDKPSSRFDSKIVGTFEDNYKLGPMSTGKYISHSENYESCS